MAKSNDDAITRALAIVSAVEYSRAANGYVLSTDQRNELMRILEDDSDAARETSGQPSKRAKKR